MSNKVIITAAISGAEVTKEMNPEGPYTLEEYVREAKSGGWRRHHPPARPLGRWHPHPGPRTLPRFD